VNSTCHPQATSSHHIPYYTSTAAHPLPQKGPELLLAQLHRPGAGRTAPSLLPKQSPRSQRAPLTWAAVVEEAGCLVGVGATCLLLLLVLGAVVASSAAEQEHSTSTVHCYPRRMYNGATATWPEGCCCRPIAHAVP
jgi:hypothetical protein